MNCKITPTFTKVKSVLLAFFILATLLFGSGNRSANAAVTRLNTPTAAEIIANNQIKLPGPIFNPDGTLNTGSSGNSSGQDQSGGSSSLPEAVTNFAGFVTNLGAINAIPSDVPGIGLAALETILKEWTSYGGDHPTFEQPSAMATHLKNPGRMGLTGNALARLPQAKANLEALIKAVNKMDKTALTDAQNQFPGAFEIINAYGSGGTGTGGGGPGTGTGTGSGTGTGTGGTPPAGSCTDTSSVTQSGGNYLMYNVGELDGSKDTFQVLLKQYMGYSHLDEDRQSAGTVGFPINEVGPLLMLTGQNKTLLVQICTNIAEVDKDVKAMLADIKAIRKSTDNIDKTTTDLNNWLKKKELTDDPKAWDDAKKGIADEATTFANLVLAGRDQAIKDNVPRTKKIGNSRITVLAADTSKGDIRTDTYTPDINIYEAQARQNAGLLFEGELKNYFLNNDLAANPALSDAAQKALLQIIDRKAKNETAFNNEAEKFSRLGKEITNPIDAERFISSLYDSAVTRAGQNAISEFVAGNTFVGSKTCDNDDAYIDTYQKDDKGNTVVICKKNSVKILTPAPVIRDLAGKFGIAKLDIAIAADEKGEKADVSGITDAVKNGCPSGKKPVKAGVDKNGKPIMMCEKDSSSSECPAGQKRDPNDGSKCIPNVTNCGFGKHSDPADPTQCIDDNCLADEAWDVVAGKCEVVSCGPLEHWNPGLKECQPGAECATGQTRDTHGVCQPTGPGGCPQFPDAQHWNDFTKSCVSGAECEPGETRDSHGTCQPPGGIQCPTGQTADTYGNCKPSGPGGCPQFPDAQHWNDVTKSCVLGAECNTGETRDSHGVCQVASSPSSTKYSNLASVGSLSIKKSPANLNFSVRSTTSQGGVKKSIISLETFGANACIATSNWLTYIKPLMEGKTEPSLIFKIGDIVPITDQQLFEIVHPRAFDLAVTITKHDLMSVNSRQPLPQTNMLSSITNGNEGLTQRTAYTPDLTNVEVGDIVTLKINTSEISINVVEPYASDVVNRITMEATSGALNTKQAFANYSFKQSGNILIVSNKSPIQNSIPDQVTYSLECNVNNEPISKSVNVIFP